MKMKSDSQHYPGLLRNENGSDHSIHASAEAGVWSSAAELNALAVLLPDFFKDEAQAGKRDFQLIPGDQPLVRVTRLVILVPEVDFDSFELARRVWRLALPGRLSVLFITLASDEQNAAFLHQRLTHLAFLTADRRLRVAKVIVTSHNWPGALRQVLQSGDLPVCLDGLQVKSGLIQKQDLATLIASQGVSAVLVMLNIPVESASAGRRQWNTLLAWVCSALTMVGFGFIQIRLSIQASGLTLNLFLILSMLIEFFLIFKINTWIG
jgi:hypothetical protein